MDSEFYDSAKPRKNPLQKKESKSAVENSKGDKIPPEHFCASVTAVSLCFKNRTQTRKTMEVRQLAATTRPMTDH